MDQNAKTILNVHGGGNDFNIGTKPQPSQNLTHPPFMLAEFAERISPTVGDLQNALETDKRVWLNAEGGMGKTTFAAEYWKTHGNDYKHRAWLDGSTSLQNALNNLVDVLHCRSAWERAADEAGQRDVIVAHLANLKAPILLIADNIDEKDAFTPFYMALGKLENAHILVTSRLNTHFGGWKMFDLYAFTPNESIMLFEQYFGKKTTQNEQKTLHLFLEKVGYNTLVIELLAKNLRSLQKDEPDYNLEAYCADLEKDGLLDIENGDIDITYKTQNLEESTVQAVVQRMYDLASLSDENKHFLTQFAVMPPVVTTAMIKHLLLDEKTKVSQALKPFLQNGWLRYNEDKNTYAISPVLQMVLCNVQKGKLLEKVAGLVNKLDEVFKYENNQLVYNIQEVQTYVEITESVLQRIPQNDIGLATLHIKIGDFALLVGDSLRAKTHFQYSNHIMLELMESGRNNLDFKRKLAVSYHKMGAVAQREGKIEEAKAHFQNGLEIMLRLVEAEPDNKGFKLVLSVSYGWLGDVAQREGKIEEAKVHFQNYNRIMFDLTKIEPKNVGFKRELSVSYNKLGDIGKRAGKNEDAKEYFRKGIETMLELVEAEPNNVGFKHDLSVSYSRFGDVALGKGENDDAKVYYQKDLEIMLGLIETEPDNVAFKPELSVSYSRLGDVAKRERKYDDAKVYYQKGLEIMLASVETEPDNVSFKRELSVSYGNLGYILGQGADFQEARCCYEASRRLLEELITQVPTWAEVREDLKIVEALLRSLPN